MSKQKWTEKRGLRRAGLILFLLCGAAGFAYIFHDNFRAIFLIIAGLGAFFLLGELLIFIGWRIYKRGGGKREEKPGFEEIAIYAAVVAAIALTVTLIQERLIKFPRKYGDPIFFSNMVIVAVSFLWGRASKKCEERDD